MKKKLLFSLLFTFTFFTIFSQNEPTDCSNAIIVCGNINLELNSNGVGTNDFATSANNAPDCGFSENQSLWLKVTIVQSGTLAFTITPESANRDEDYDFAIYGPNVTCSNLGSSIRCSSTNPAAAGVSTLTGLNNTETDSSEGPGEDGTGFVRFIDAIAGEEYIILIDNFSRNGGFDLTFTGTAILPDTPVNMASSTNLDLTECDMVGDSGDGRTYFNLDSNTAAILGTQTNTLVSYHATEENASINASPLTSSYLSLQNNQTIYVRIENTITGCFVTDTFKLITISGPQIITPAPFTACDNNNDGNDTNGSVSFLLRDKDNEILNGLDPGKTIITYHLSQTDANTNTGVIDKNTPFINTTNPQTIFVRAQYEPSHPCVNIASFTNFNLEVNPLPIANAVSLIQCDEYFDPTDGITLFNLNEATNQITGDPTNRTLLFFEDIGSANTGTPSITNTTNYQNKTINQQLFVRVINNLSGCFRITTLDLGVSVTSASDAIITICDDDGNEDGFREFDLSLANDQIISGISQFNLRIAYYETIENALSELNPITTFINNTPLTQGQDIVFARVENDLNQCFGINQVQLFLNPLPNIEPETSYFLCQNQTSIPIDSGLLPNNNPNEFTVLWSTNETTETIIVNQPGVYIVEVTNIATNCSKIRTVEVIPSSVAVIESIDILDARDNNIVTINAIGLGDYEYAIEINGTLSSYQDNATFTNVPPGFHRVYVRDKNGCVPVTIQEISVVGFPKYFTPNGDGFHETWNVKGISAEVMPSSLIFIFDRYGKLLKQLKAGDPGWDGNYAGKMMPSGEYWFRVTLDDGRTITGSFSLIR